MHTTPNTKTQKAKTKTPDFVRVCHRCGGSGRVPCQFCSGTGYVTTRKDRLGMPIKERCTACFGNRLERCYTCGGSGRLHQF